MKTTEPKFIRRRFHLRVLVCLPVFVILLVCHMAFVCNSTWLFLKYGGEWINFKKPERETITSIYEMLKEIKENQKDGKN